MSNEKHYRSQLMGQPGALNGSSRTLLEIIKASNDRASAEDQTSSPRKRTVALRFDGSYSFRLERLSEGFDTEELQSLLLYPDDEDDQEQREEKQIAEVAEHILPHPSVEYPPQENEHVDCICAALEDDETYEYPWLKCRRCEAWQKSQCVKLVENGAARLAFICENCLAPPIRWTAINGDAYPLDESKGPDIALSLPRKYLEGSTLSIKPTRFMSISFHPAYAAKRPKRTRSSYTLTKDPWVRVPRKGDMDRRRGQELPVARSYARLLFKTFKRPKGKKWRIKIKVKSLESGGEDLTKRTIAGVSRSKPGEG